MTGLDKPYIMLTGKIPYLSKNSGRVRGYGYAYKYNKTMLDTCCKTEYLWGMTKTAQYFLSTTQRWEK